MLSMNLMEMLINAEMESISFSLVSEYTGEILRYQLVLRNYDDVTAIKSANNKELIIIYHDTKEYIFNIHNKLFKRYNYLMENVIDYLNNNNYKLSLSAMYNAYSNCSVQPDFKVVHENKPNNLHGLDKDVYDALYGRSHGITEE